MEFPVILYGDLVEVVLSNDREADSCMTTLAIGVTDWSDEQVEQLRAFLETSFLVDFKRKWRKVNRNRERFKKKFGLWTKKEFSVTPAAPAPRAGGDPVDGNELHVRGTTCKHARGGRPKEPFSDCCARSRQRNVREGREKFDSDKGSAQLRIGSSR